MIMEITCLTCGRSNESAYGVRSGLWNSRRFSVYFKSAGIWPTAAVSYAFVFNSVSLDEQENVLAPQIAIVSDHKNPIHPIIPVIQTCLFGNALTADTSIVDVNG